MKKRITILSGLLLAQLVLAAAVNLRGEDYGIFQTAKMLLSFEQQAVDGLQLDDGTDSLVLKKQTGQWLLPESGNFPADSNRVERLLDTLAALEKGWSVAKTRGAARRFKVGEDQFEQKLVLLSGEEPQATLYIGSSPGFRKVYVRSELANDVFAVAFDRWTAGAKTDDWIDKDILTLEESEVERVEISGVTLQRQDGKWQVTDLAEKEQTNSEASRTLITKLSRLRIQSLLGTGAKPEYRQDETAFELKLTRQSGEVLSYRFSKPEDATYYVLKRSDLEQYFKMAEYTVNPVKEITREALVQARVEDTSNEAPEDARGEIDDVEENADEEKSADGEEEPVEAEK